MFNKPVVLVVGAGASKEYNFPLGGALKEAIAEKVKFRFQRGSHLSSGDLALLDHIRRHAPDNTFIGQFRIGCPPLPTKQNG